jgi:hypothetical protein
VVAPGGPPLGGRYELQSLLAAGGMGQVWCARDLLLGRPVAVKLLRSEYAGDPTFRARFRAEAQHAALLHHRNIAAVFDYGEAADERSGEQLAYLVMELVDGEPLSAVLARDGRLPVARTLDVLRQTAAGLAAAHAGGVVHRDVKPGNVLVGRDGVVRITDFGVAWSASDVPLTQTGQVVGTAQYLSPEQAEGGRGGPASDVYALGLIGYECLAGRRAFDGGTPVQVAMRRLREEPEPLPDDVPEAVRALIGRALCKDPEARFPDGAAVRDAVDDVLAGRPLPLGSPTRPLGHPPADRRRLSLRLLVPLAALAAGVGLGVGALQVLTPAAAIAPAAEAPPATGVTLVPGDYVGRAVDDVEAELLGLGLGIARAPEETAAAAPGTVLGVSPTGKLAAGSLVTLRYAVAPASPSPSSTAQPQTSLVEAGSTSPTSPGAAVPVPVQPAAQPAQPPTELPTEQPAQPPATQSAVEAEDDQGGKAKGNGKGNGNAGGNGPGNGNGNGRGNG